MANGFIIGGSQDIAPMTVGKMFVIFKARNYMPVYVRRFVAKAG